MAEFLLLGSRVRALRKERGLTQRQLAARAGVGLRTVHRIENEPGVRFNFTVVMKVSQALGVPLELTDTEGLRCTLLRYSA